MAKAKKKPKAQSSTIALNKKAKHDYHLTDKTEAGLVLAGWEVKSLRDGRVTLTDTYVIFQRQEAWLVGAHITPLNTASTHVVAEPMRSRKLLLHRREIEKMMGLSEQKGYTVVATALYWKSNRVKCEVALAKGKKEFDKRADQKEKDWNKQKERLMKHSY